MSDTRRSPLHRLHEEAGAGFTDFGGWLMPVRYSSDLAEHHAVRTAAGIFDISHMGEILVAGADAAVFLDHALAGRLSAIDPFQAKYTLLLAEDGGIIDDLIVYRFGEQSFLVVANAGNRIEAAQALAARTDGFSVTVNDVSDDYALIAVQGPNALAIVSATSGITDVGAPLGSLGYYRATDAFFEGSPLLIARTGYTGEDGFELYVGVDEASRLWAAFMTAGAPLGLVPAGLAARDTLRLEAGMPLYGHELGRDTLPEQAGLARTVPLASKGDFVGRAAVERGPDAGARVLVGLASEGRRAGRAGYPVALDGREVGIVTSGALSPTLGHPIAMAFVDPDLTAPGTELAIDVRGTTIPATVTRLPFYKREN